MKTSDIEKQLGGLGWGEAGYCEHLCSATNHYKSRGDGKKKKEKESKCSQGRENSFDLGVHNSGPFLMYL